MLDSAYQQKGAKIVSDIESVDTSIDFVLRVKRPSDIEEAQFVKALKPGTTIIGFFDPRLPDANHIELYQSAMLCTFSWELWSFDLTKNHSALSKMSKLSGKITISEHTRIFGIRCTKLLILGLGSLGMSAAEQAIEMGIDLTVVSTSPQKKSAFSSLSCKFVEINDKQDYQETVKDLLFNSNSLFDMIITSARDFNGDAPVILTKRTIQALPPTIIVDFSATSGGNCEGSKPDASRLIGRSQVVNVSGVPKLKPDEASIAYSTCMYKFVESLTSGEKRPSITSTCMTCDGLVSPKLDSSTNRGEFISAVTQQCLLYYPAL